MEYIFVFGVSVCVTFSRFAFGFYFSLETCNTQAIFPMKQRKEKRTHIRNKKHAGKSQRTNSTLEKYRSVNKTSANAKCNINND